MDIKREQMVQQQRIVWLDVVKYICIIMVMLSHLEANTGLWYAFYSPFFLSAFLFAAGYVYKQKDSFREFLYKKFRQLFIPWLVFSLFDILLAQVISFNQHENLLADLKWNFLQIRGLGDKIWFVAALFVAFIPFYLFIYCFESKHSKPVEGKYSRCTVAILIAWVLSLTSILYSRLMPTEVLPWNSSALPWHIEYMFQAMFFMVLGYLFRGKTERWLDEHNTVINRIAVWMIYLIVVYVPYFMGIEMPLLIGIMYDYMEALLGITAVIMVSKAIRYVNRYVNYVGQNTLICFALHGKIYSVIQTILKRFMGGTYAAILGNTLASSVVALVISLLLSVLLIVPAYIINHWFPFIMGRTRKIKGDKDG